MPPPEHVLPHKPPSDRSVPNSAPAVLNRSDDCLSMPTEVVAANAANSEKTAQILTQWADITAARIGVAKAMRPDIKPELFEDMQAAIKGNMPSYIEQRNKLNQLTPEGIPPDRAVLMSRILKANQEFNKNVLNDLQNNHSDKEIHKAFAAVNCAVMTEPRPSLGDALSKPFYNKEKDEFRFGGLLGAVGGLLGGMMLFGGGEGGWMSYVGIAIMAVVGIISGNKIAEMFDTPKTPTVLPVVGRGRSPAPTVEKPTTNQEQEQEKPINAPSRQDIRNSVQIAPDDTLKNYADRGDFPKLPVVDGVVSRVDNVGVPSTPAVMLSESKFGSKNKETQAIT